MFDYIVVGAGSAGSAAAATLATHPSRPSVLLLDSGDWDRATDYYGSSIVNASFNSWRRPMFWLARSMPPFRVLSNPGYALKVAMALGGGSAVNRGLHSWGALSELAPALQWPEAEISASFQRLHRRYGASASARREVAPVYRGWDFDALPAFLQDVVHAFGAAGVPYRIGKHADSGTTSIHGVYSGVWLSLRCRHGAMRGGDGQYSHVADDLRRCARQSAYTGLVTPINNSHPNLVIRPSSLAVGLRWREESRQRGIDLQQPHQALQQPLWRVGGVDVVELHRAEKRPVGEMLHFENVAAGWESQISGHYTAGVRRAVVLAAGALNSPALLFRSGVGTPSSARRLRVKPRVNLSTVGVGLRDRVAVSTTVVTNEACDMKARRVDDIPSIFAFFNFSSPTAGQGGGSSGPVEAELNVVDDCVDGLRSASLRFILQRTERAGRLHVLSPNPFVAPHAELHATEGDLHRVMSMLRWFREHVLGVAAVEKHILDMFPDDAIMRDEHALGEMVKQSAEWYLHPMGSLAVGEAVDSSLLVHGTSNVRVADASVLPGGVPSGHPDATIRALGEVTAQRLLALSADVPENMSSF